MRQESDSLWGDTNEKRRKDGQEAKPEDRLLRSKYRFNQGEDVKHGAVQIGYGEITFESFNKLIIALQNQGLNKDSVFVDIGSGFGSAVIQTAFTSQALSIGVEVIEPRVQFSNRKLQQFREEYKSSSNILQILQKIQFLHNDICKFESMKTPEGICFTHIYVFDKVMDINTRATIIELINRSPWVKALIWTRDPKTTLKQFKLKDFDIEEKHSKITMQGSGEQSTFYLYVRKQSQLTESVSQINIEEEEKQEIIINTYSKSNSILKKRSFNERQKSSRKRYKSSRGKESLSSIQECFNEDLNEDLNDSQNVYQIFKQHTNVPLIQMSAMNSNLEESQSSWTKEFQKAVLKIEQKSSKLKGSIQTSEFFLQQLQINLERLYQILPEFKCDQDQLLSLGNVSIKYFSQGNYEKLSNDQQEYLKSLIEICNQSKIKDLFLKRKVKKIIDFQREKLGNYKEVQVQLKDIKEEVQEFISMELQKSQLQIQKELGIGSFGRVYECKWKSSSSIKNSSASSMIVAVKVPILQDSAQMENEIKYLMRLKQKNSSGLRFIVKVIKIIDYYKSKAMIMDFYPHRLFELQQKEKLNAKQIKFIAYGILRAVEAAHEEKIVHRDIKPENIMLDSNWVPKLCDWGTANADTEVGTIGYQAPELYNSDDVKKIEKFKVDSWSLGITLYSLANNGEFPIPQDEIDKFVKSGKEFKFKEDIELAKDGILGIVRKLTYYNQSRRSSPAKVLQDEYFNGVKEQFKSDLDISKLT